ncbi:MAG: DUF3237 domain-containing protein [Pseudomonadota bacterium]
MNNDLEYELLYEMFAGLDAPIDVGAGPEGHRMIVPVNGGHFKGPRMSGTVLPNSGGDWLRIRPDGSAVLDVRGALRTDDGATIYAHYKGRGRFQSPEQMAQILDYGTDSPIDGSEYYLRIAPEYETGSEAYAWLNSMVAIGVGQLGHGGITYRVYAIK